MSNLSIINTLLVTPSRIIENGWLQCTNGVITAMGTGDAPYSDEVIIAQGQIVLPGFVDVHVHGAMNADVMDATPEALHKMARFKAEHGVTSFLPTTLTDSHERLVAALHNIQAVMNTGTQGARLIGAHLEGPYLNLAKAGAQNPQHIRPVTMEEANELLDVGVIRLLSLAPEIDGADVLLNACVQRGITVSVAHTDASHTQTTSAIEQGVTHATHTGNAMRGIHHREVGTLGTVLLDDRVRCEMIADFEHLAPEAVRLFSHVAGLERVMLITDAMRATGMPDGNYSLGEYTATVHEGRATLEDGTLAGSVLTMDVALRNFMQATNTPLERAWRVASMNAAQSINMSHRIGSIEIGKAADLVVLNDQHQVQMTLVGGEIVHRV